MYLKALKVGTQICKHRDLQPPAHNLVTKMSYWKIDRIEDNLLFLDLPCQKWETPIWNECRQNLQSLCYFLVPDYQTGCTEMPEFQSLHQPPNISYKGENKGKGRISAKLLREFMFFVIHIRSLHMQDSILIRKQQMSMYQNSTCKRSNYIDRCQLKKHVRIQYKFHMQTLIFILLIHFIQLIVIWVGQSAAGKISKKKKAMNESIKRKGKTKHD